MLIDELTKEFNELLEEKNFNYSNPDVVEKGLELEKEMFKNFQNEHTFTTKKDIAD